MSMTKIGVATLSDELLNYIKEQIKAGTLEWSDLIDTPDYTGQDGKFLQATSTGGSASMSWRDLPEMGISWGTQSTDVVAIDKKGYLASNGITITLPSNPEEGDLIAVTDANGEFDSSPVTVITVDGNLIESDTTLTLDLRNTFIQLIFDGTVWQISQLNSPFNVQEITEESFPGGQITYTLSRIPPNRSSVLITNAGKVVTTDKYSVVGNILTFGTVPVGTVYVRHIGVPSSVRVSDMPVGAMAYFPNGEDIDGWLDATGATISSSLYPDLVAYLTKDPGALTAKLPDPRGNFVRTWDHGSGLDTASQTVIPAYLKDNLWGKWLDTTDENTSANLWDGNTSTRTTVNKAQGYVGYRFDVPVKVDYANINSNDALGSAYLPTSMQLKASNDGVTWIVASNSVTGPFQGYTAQLVSNTSTPYRYWAVFGTGGSAYPTDATKYWGVTSLVFTGSTTNRLVGGFQMESVGTLSPTLNGSSSGAGSVQSGTGATALIVGGEGTSTGGTETRPDNQAYVLKIKAYHYQSGSLSDSNVTALRGEVSRLSTLVEDSKSYVSPTPPAEPKLNSRWYDTTTGRTYIWFFDGDSYQWVDDSPQSTSSAAENINFAEVLTSGTTEERSLRERFGDLRNILDFGGRRNSTDDSKAAFDLAGNGPVFIPEGTYFVSSGDYSNGSYYSFGPVTVTGGSTGIRVVNLGVTQVDSIKDLQGLVGTEGQQITVASYHGLDDLSGGGVFVWSTGRHNGGTFIDPARAFPEDWNDQAQLTAWFADSGIDVIGWERRYSSTVNAAWFGAKEGVSDSYRSVQKALDTHPEVEVSKGYVTNTMVVIGERKVLRILANAYLIRTDVNNHDPVVWLAKNQASLIGSSFSASSIYTQAKAPKGIVRIGHKDMTESHDNVNYCSLSGLSIVGKQIYGQGSGEPDISVAVYNPQFGELTSYFHNITDIKMQYSNYGLVLNGYANGNIIRGLQGIHLGNATTSQGAMIWLNGALDNVLQGAFFHTSPDSIMLKLTDLDNSANGGVQHNLYANTITGLVAEQGGSNALGVWTDTGGSKQFIEMRHNVSGGNVLTPAWGDDGIFFGLQGGRGIGSLIVEGDGTDDARYKFVADGRYLHDTESIASPNPAKHQYKGSINVDQKTTKVYNGTSDVNMVINHSIAQNGSSYKYVSLNLKISAYSGAGAVSIAEYSCPLGGLSTWELGTPTNIHGGAFSIVDYGSDATTSYIRVENASGLFMTVEACVMGYFTATFNE